MTVRLITITDDYWGLTTRDLELARQISGVAREQGAPADPSTVQNMVIVFDALVIPEVLSFWRAVVGYQPRADAPEEELNDPHSRWPFFYFQQMDAPRRRRGRIHIDVFVPHDQVEARVEAALAAGGRVVSDNAPSAWTLADTEGNEVCVCTAWLGDD